MIPWWSMQTGALFGAIGGSVCGLLGAAIGLVRWKHSARGTCKPLMLTLIGIELGVGIISLGLGIIALTVHQPYAVWYPLVLLGSINTIVAGAIAPSILRDYRQAEIRRLEAENIRRT